MEPQCSIFSRTYRPCLDHCFQIEERIGSGFGTLRRPMLGVNLIKTCSNMARYSFHAGTRPLVATRGLLRVSFTLPPLDCRRAPELKLCPVRLPPSYGVAVRESAPGRHRCMVRLQPLIWYLVITCQTCLHASKGSLRPRILPLREKT